MKTLLRILTTLVLGLAMCAPAAAQYSSESGFAILQQNCMTCHGQATVPRAPSVGALRELSPERIYEVLNTSGIAAHQTLKLSDEDKKSVAESTSARILGTSTSGDAKNMPNRCASNPPMADPSASPGWNGWGNDTGNTRFQPAKAAGLTADQASRLKVKWTFGIPGGRASHSQPTVASGRVFVGSDTGWLYSIDASTGCVYWSFLMKGGTRTAPTVAPIKGQGSAKYAVYIGDLKSYVYAVDAQTGRGLWTSRVDDHYGARITGAATVYDGKVFVPLAKWESNSARVLSYACSSVRGSVTPLDANTGKQIWKHYTIEEPPKPVRINSAGTQLWAPSGGTVWNAPTVDTKLGVIYYGTGEATSHPAGLTTDAVLAVDIKTGKRVWSYQGTANDAYIIGCTGATITENCPENIGPDNDIGASPILMTLSNGKRVLVAAQKMGDVFALDPDNKGTTLWRVKLGPGGIVWGGAAEGDLIYYGLTGGGVIAIKAANGERVWYNELQPPPGKGRSANGAAVSAMPGVVFSGSRTGMFYALSSANGAKLWEFDTARDFETNNRVPAHGGTMGSAGSTIAGGMVFVGSGYNFGNADKTGNVIIAFSAD